MVGAAADFSDKAAALQTALASVRLAVGVLVILWGVVVLLGGALAKIVWAKLSEIGADVKAAADHSIRITKVEGEIASIREWRHDLGNTLQEHDGRVIALEEWRKGHDQVVKDRVEQVKDLDHRVRILEQQ